MTSPVLLLPSILSSPVTMSPSLPPRMPDRPRSAPIEPKSSSSLTSLLPPRPSYPPPPQALLSRASSLVVLLSSASTPALARSALHALRSFQTSADSFEEQLQVAAALDATVALPVLVELTGLYHESAQLQALALNAMADWRLSTHALAALPRGEAAEAVAASLRTHSQTAEVAAPALHCLAALAGVPPQREALARCNVLQLARHALVTHSGDVAVGIAAARFIGTAAADPRLSETVAKDGTLQQLLNASRAAPRNRELACCVAAVIRNVTAAGGYAATLAVDAGAPRDLVAVLQMHAGVERTVTHALAALLHIVRSGGERALFVTEGWAEALCETARTMFDRHIVQTLVMGIGLGMREKEMVEQLVRYGAVQVTINGMHRHVTHRDVLYYGSRFLRGLLEGSEGGMEEVRKCGGVERLLDLLYCSVARPVVVQSDVRYSGHTEGL